MKRKQTKKLALGKIKIASLRKADQAKLNGGELPATTWPTKLTRCFICPVTDICQ